MVYKMFLYTLMIPYNVRCFKVYWEPYIGCTRFNCSEFTNFVCPVKHDQQNCEDYAKDWQNFAIENKKKTDIFSLPPPKTYAISWTLTISIFIYSRYINCKCTLLEITSFRRCKCIPIQFKKTYGNILPVWY